MALDLRLFTGVAAMGQDCNDQLDIIKKRGKKYPPKIKIFFFAVLSHYGYSLCVMGLCNANGYNKPTYRLEFTNTTIKMPNIRPCSQILEK
jgi:hypothetical protein